MGRKQRLTLGIILNFSSKWMGGVIYIINLIKILNWLDEVDKPEIKLFYRRDLKRFVDEINYPYLEAIEWTFPTLRTGYLKSWLSGKNRFIYPILENHELDALYPVMDFPFKTKSSTKLMSWYADLQHKNYPRFFSRKKCLERNLRIKFMLKHTDGLVLSSEAVRNDFYRFFDMPDQLQTFIFHFASVIDSFDFSNIAELREQHGIPEKYFLVSNQFHKHKNHELILEALGELKSRNKYPFIAMTGRLPDDSSSPYLLRLKALLGQYDLHEQVSFMGVLSRQDQLTLMHHAQAVIQPSLFEGWSTVIEDAISVQTPIIASEIAPNVEQLGDEGIYFSPHNPSELADAIDQFSAVPDRKPVDPTAYDQHIRDTARSFIELFQ